MWAGPQVESQSSPSATRWTRWNQQAPSQKELPLSHLEGRLWTLQSFRPAKQKEEAHSRLALGTSTSRENTDPTSPIHSPAAELPGPQRGHGSVQGQSTVGPCCWFI